jgi:uncharacterized protein (TIGR01777 family)
MKRRVILAGGSGLIGSACKELLLKEGYEVKVLTRKKNTAADEVSWDPQKQWIASNIMEGAFAVINLCGESLDKHRWTKGNKEILTLSRTIPSSFLASLINDTRNKPSCYIGISGISGYGDQGSVIINDDYPVTGMGFIADLVRKWESSHREVRDVRTVILRTGVVVSPRGGFLSKFRLPMSLGLFPFFVKGDQILSWISMQDLTSIILFALYNTEVGGTYHATAPQPISNRQFMIALRKASGHPGVLFPIPAFVLRVMFGEMSALLLDSLGVRPDKMIRAGFVFHHPEMHSALQYAIEKHKRK